MKPGIRLLLPALLLHLPLTQVRAQADDNYEPARCIRLSTIDRTEVIDNRHIAFYLRNGDIYVNELDKACLGLRPGKPFAYQTPTGQICNVDIVNVLENFGFGLSRGASCPLGMFVPADEETIEMLKGAEEAADVTVVPIEVEVEVEDEDEDEDEDEEE